MKKTRNTKYTDVVDYLYNLIEDGTLKPGDKIESENSLAAKFNTSRQTVRKGLTLLEQMGKIRGVQGSGTYVSFDREASMVKKNCIAVVMTFVDCYIFPGMIRGIEKVLSEKGYLVQMYFTSNTTSREQNILEELLSRDDLAGVLIEGTKSAMPNPNLGFYQQLIRRKIPMLFFNTYYPELDIPHVALNNVQAGELAAKYLISKGHKEIGAIFKLDDEQGRQRYAGYMQALEEAGIAVDDFRVVWIDTEETQKLSICTQKILHRFKECTAVLCYNDLVAYQLEQILAENGIRVPQDLSIIGIDDSELAVHSDVAITSMRHPKEELGATTAQILLDIMDGKCAGQKVKEINYEFDTTVVERDSVKEI